MNEELHKLPVSEIKLDLENPRIQSSLEKYGDNLKPEIIEAYPTNTNFVRIILGY